MGGSRTRSGEQGQAAQRRAAHGPVGLGVAAKRSSGCALGPLRDRDAKHPSAGSGFRGLPGQAGRDLHAGEGLVQEGEEWSRALWGTNRTGGSWERPGSPVARRPPSAHRPGPDHCGSEPDWPPEPLPVKSGTAPSPSLESSPLRVPRVAALWPLGAFPPFLAAEVGTGGLSSACELMLRIMTRATRRFGSAFSRWRLRRDLGEDSRLERLRPGRGSPELSPRGHNPQAFLSRAAAVPTLLQDNLRDGRGAQRRPDNTGVAAVSGDHTGVEGVRGKRTMGVHSSSTWYRRLRYSGAESWSPSCTGSRTSDSRAHSRSGQWNLCT